MTLSVNEIKPGAVAILDSDALLRDNRIRKQWQQPFRLGPFVCVHTEGGESAWFSLTTARNPMRLELRRAWLLDGSPHWRSVEQYLTDARKPYVGPNEAFCEASQKEIDYDSRHMRPRISPVGLRAIIEESMKYVRGARVAEDV